LCYMSEGTPSRVGVRELRQNLSIYLDRVKDGESLEVTERGQVVARLSPSGGGSSTYEQMVADGRISSGKGGLAELGPPPPGAGRALSDVLGELRDEEID
jgi:prevent-host-death family protein